MLQFFKTAFSFFWAASKQPLKPNLQRKRDERIENNIVETTVFLKKNDGVAFFRFQFFGFGLWGPSRGPSEVKNQSPKNRTPKNEPK